MHGDWFWELNDTEIFPPKKTNWMQVLWQTEVSRAEIPNKAGLSTSDRKRIHFERQQLLKEGMNRTSGSLSLGLRNRLRIWCCLESFGQDGTQITLSGQKMGVDPPEVQWDGSSRLAACPTCGRSNGISFNRLKMIAGGTDLT
jgi:hypothetical protein